MDWSVVISIVASVVTSLFITWGFWHVVTHQTKPQIEINRRIQGPEDDHYLVYIRNLKKNYVYDITVAAQLIIPRNDEEDDILGIPIEFKSTNNFNHIPALGPTGPRQSNPDEVGDNRFVILYFDKLPDASKRLPPPYAGETGEGQDRRPIWRGTPEQVKGLLDGGSANYSGDRKPAVWIYVDGYDEGTHARGFRKLCFTADKFPLDQSGTVAAGSQTHAVDA